MSAHVVRDGVEALELARELGAELAKGDAERDAERRLPHAEVARLAASGLLGITVPTEFGGAGVGARVLGEVIVELARGDSSVGQIPQNHFFFVDVVHHVGTPAQQEFFYGEVLAGRHFGNALSERGSRTAWEYDIRFERQPDGRYLVDGTKHYGTGTPFAAWIPIYATDRSDDPVGRLVAAWIPADHPGVTVVDDWRGMGQRTTGSGTVRFEQVLVDPDRVLPAGRMFEQAETFGALGNYIHAAVDVGIAEAALRDARELVRTVARPWPEFGVTSAAEDPLVVQEFGELVLRARAAHALLREAGDAIDAARADLTEESAAEASLAVAAARASADTAAVSISSDVFALVGTRSASTDLNLDRHWRNARTHTLHDPRRSKLRHLGNHALSDIDPPRNGWV
ncbi:SfnB family sulfur acquisition oxidoreductase [Kineococcus sp. R8]|uniref:SfnB family sulfur acquisition oxidoreductase n=1 Tax=Kineococcus siccus TaxID=2696567 RepID=UPI0014121980|nr:SfnB family sulfur acquisition oxidoreductase [Kineococcus siccus]